MDVPLPDGFVVHVQYVGDVTPKVTVKPSRMDGGFLAPTGLPAFRSFDRMFEQLNQQMRQMERIAAEPGGNPGMSVAGYGDLPAGSNSMSVVSTSNGGVTCTRTTEIVSQGAGRPPKVTTSVSGSCGDQTRSSGGPLNHT
jgi:hypothetical protein